MKQQNTTILSPTAQQLLRCDSTLGSGNFLDRCHAVSSCHNVEFLFLEEPIVLPDNNIYQAFSLDTLVEARRCLANWYLTLGVAPGDIVAVCVADGIAPFLHYLALTSLGAAAALLNPAMSPDIATAYILQNEFKRLILDIKTLESTELAARLSVNCKIENCSVSGTTQFVSFPPWWPYHPNDSTLVMLSHTSGTTGVPKAVRFEHRQFFMSKRARIGQFAESADERLLSALPQSHSAAISHLETAVLLGIPTFILSAPVGESVRAALLTFAPTVVAAFPQTYTSLVETGIAPNEFPTVRRWFSMGDAAHEKHIRSMLIGSPQSRFIDAFGSSELGMAIFRKVSTSTEIAPRRSIGRPVEMAIAKVLDFSTGEELHFGEIGLIAVRAPTITSGYWRQPELTSMAWRNGYFLTGDVGFCKNGDFYQVDRSVDIIASAIGPFYTLLLEETIQEVDGVCNISVVGAALEPNGSDCIFALVLPDCGEIDRAEALGDRVWIALHDAVHKNDATLPPYAIVVAIAHDFSFFPVGATGKVLKRRLREKYPAMIDALMNGDKSPEGVLYLTNGVTKAWQRASNGANNSTDNFSLEKLRLPNSTNLKSNCF